MFREPYKNTGSLWFRRLLEDCKRISSHIRVKRIKNGFFRIYYKQAYIHEIYKEAPPIGYTMDSLDPRFESKKFWESKEDKADLTRNVKNFVEGYWDSLDRIRTRVYLFRNNDEFYKIAIKGYRTAVIK